MTDSQLNPLSTRAKDRCPGGTTALTCTQGAGSQGDPLTPAQAFDATRELFGNIDGDEVRFQSRYSVPGDTLTMTFYGKLSGDTITGEIDMVEYVNAKFTAKRATFPNNRQRINIPAGRPLST